MSTERIKGQIIKTALLVFTPLKNVRGRNAFTNLCNLVSNKIARSLPKELFAKYSLYYLKPPIGYYDEVFKCQYNPGLQLGIVYNEDTIKLGTLPWITILHMEKNFTHTELEFWNGVLIFLRNLLVIIDDDYMTCYKTGYITHDDEGKFPHLSDKDKTRIEKIKIWANSP